MIPTTVPAARAIHRRRKRSNFVHSVVLLGGMLMLAALIGWILAGPNGLIWAFAAGAISLVFSPRVSPRVVLRLYGARRLAPHEVPRLFEVVEAISGRAGLPATPEIHHVASPTLNAFAVGRSSQAAIAVTDGLLRVLTLREVAGVLAHEISHIRNNDLFVMGLADTAASLTRFLSLFGLVLLFVNLPYLMQEAQPIPWPLILILMAAPTVGLLLQLALSRTREYDADLDAAHLTGDPEGLAAALDRIERIQGRFWEGFPLPSRRPRADPSLLRTHPHTEERIRRLLALRAPPPVVPALDTLPLHVAIPEALRRPRHRVSGYWW